MQKVVFNNRTFYILLISLIILLIGYNSYILIVAANPYVLITIFIEIVLLILIFTKHRYAKIGIFIWAILALIIGYGFELIASMMDDFAGDAESSSVNSLLYNFAGLVIGIAIIYFTKKTVIVKTE